MSDAARIARAYLELSGTEISVADAALRLADAVDASPEARALGFWAEELIPLEREEDLHRNALRTRPGAEKPQAGFTLWRKDTAYRVTVEPL